MKLRIKKCDGGFLIICVLLALCAMNFKAKFHYFVYACFFAVLLNKKKVVLNNNCFVYMCLSILMAIYNCDEGLLSMLRCLSVFLLYFIGYNLTAYVSNTEQTYEKKLLRSQQTLYTIIRTICVGSFVHYLLNAVINMGSVTGRNTFDVWSGSVMAATGQATLASLMLGFSVALIYKPLKKTHRYIGILCIAVALFYNLILAGRTMLVILCVLIGISYIYINKIEKRQGNKIKLAVGLIVIICGIILVVALNIGGLKELILSSNLYARMNQKGLSILYDSPRTLAKQNFILNAWKYPFGGLNLLAEYGYAHDLLLDGYDEYGLIGLILLVIIVINGIRTVYHTLRCDSYNDTLKLTILCVYMSILLVFCVEPILAGMFWLFSCYCLVNGCLDGIHHVYRLRKLEKKDENSAD